MALTDRPGPDPADSPLAFRPPRESHRMLLWGVIWAVLLLLAAGWAHDRWWAEGRRSPPAQPDGATRQPRPKPAPADARGTERGATQRPLGPSGSNRPTGTSEPRGESRPAAVPTAIDTQTTRQVLKCVVNGQVTYADPRGCKGTVVSTMEILVDNTPAVAPRPVAPAPNQNPAPMQPLPEANELAAQNEALQRRARQAQAAAEAQRRTQCAQLDQNIQTLDSEARQPRSGYRQDQIRSERQWARSRQFELRC